MNLTQYMRYALAIIIILCGNTIIGMDHLGSSSSSCHAVSSAIAGVIDVDDQFELDMFVFRTLSTYQIMMLKCMQLDPNTMLCSKKSVIEMLRRYSESVIEFFIHSMDSPNVTSFNARSTLRILDDLVESGVNIVMLRPAVTKYAADITNSREIDSMLGDVHSQSRRRHALRAFELRFNQLADWQEHTVPLLHAQRHVNRAPHVVLATTLIPEIAALVNLYHSFALILPDYDARIEQELTAMKIDVSAASTVDACTCLKNIVLSIAAAMTCCMNSNPCCVVSEPISTTSPSSAAASNNTYAAGGAARAHESSSAQAERKNRE